MDKITASSLGFREENLAYPGFTNSETAQVWHLLRKSQALMTHAQVLIAQIHQTFRLDQKNAQSTAADQLQRLVGACWPATDPIETRILVETALAKNVNWIELQARILASSPDETHLHQLEYIDLRTDKEQNTYQYSSWFTYHLRISSHRHSSGIAVGFLDAKGEVHERELVTQGNAPVDLLLQTKQRFFVEVTLAPFSQRQRAYLRTDSSGIKWDTKLNEGSNPAFFALRKCEDFPLESAKPPRDRAVEALLLAEAGLEEGRSSPNYPNSAFIAEKTLAFLRSRGYTHDDIGESDFVCSRDETTWVVEAMGGHGNLRYAHIDFQFALGRLLSRFSDFGIRYGLAFPDDFAYTQYCTAFWGELREKLNLHFFFVQPNGLVRVEPGNIEI